ncbi:MAG: signal peptidase II [Erysipelotrichaceae bacterium]|nr:signal peptidase II [Erysipelotrichaceae bacterium]
MNIKISHILLLLFTVLSDFLTKHYISTNLKLYETIEVIPNFFDITYVLNDGAAWSILKGQIIFFYIISVIALGVLVFMYLKTYHNDGLSKFGIVLMIGGTIGNFIDRLRFQYVIDFLSFQFGSYHFPVFNLADSFLVIGVGCLILSMLLKKEGSYV